MKITKYVNVEAEIEVEVSAEDIARALAEEPENERIALQGINNMKRFMDAIPPAMINGMGEKVREIVSGFFAEQAERFRIE